MRRRFLILTGLALAVIMVLSLAPAQQDVHVAEAQENVTTSNIVLRAFSNYIGINPPLTAEELEFTEAEDRRFDVSFTFRGLDLSTGLSCDSRVMDEDELLVGAPVGWRYLITINRRVYEFRTDYNGTRIIRCYFGREIDFNPAGRGIGPSIDGETAVRRAMEHLSGYLDLNLSIERANEPEEGDPSVFYRWSAPVVFNDASLGCPLRGADYDVRDTLAWYVTLTVNGRVYPYRVRMDGNVVLLCWGGRPDETSIGLPAVASDTE